MKLEDLRKAARKGISREQVEGPCDLDGCEQNAFTKDEHGKWCFGHRMKQIRDTIAPEADGSYEGPYRATMMAGTWLTGYRTAASGKVPPTVVMPHKKAGTTTITHGVPCGHCGGKRTKVTERDHDILRGVEVTIVKCMGCDELTSYET